jgi:hypothetical protein
MLKRKKYVTLDKTNRPLMFKASPTINGYGGGCVLEGKYFIYRPDCGGPRIPGPR